jgi:hypothetical protein
MANTNPQVQIMKIPGFRASVETRAKLDRLRKEKGVKWSEFARQAIDAAYHAAFGDEPPKPQRTRRKKE